MLAPADARIAENDGRRNRHGLDPTQTVFVACQLNYDSLVSDSKESSGAISTTVRSAFPPSCAKDRTSTSKQQWTNTIPTAASPHIDGVPCFPEGPGLSGKHGTHFSISRDFWPTCGISVWKRAEPCNIACGHGGHYG